MRKAAYTEDVGEIDFTFWWVMTSHCKGILVLGSIIHWRTFPEDKPLVDKLNTKSVFLQGNWSGLKERLSLDNYIVVLSTFNIYFPDNFQVYNIVLLTKVIMLYYRAPELITTSFCTLINIFPTPLSPQYLETTNLLFVSNFSFFQIAHISEVIQYLSFSVWPISLSMMPQGRSCCHKWQNPSFHG